MVVDRRAVAARLAEGTSPGKPSRLAPQARSGVLDGAEMTRLPASPSDGPDREWTWRRPTGPAGIGNHPESGWRVVLGAPQRPSSAGTEAIGPGTTSATVPASHTVVQAPQVLVGCNASARSSRRPVSRAGPSPRRSPSARTSVDPDLSHRGGDAVNAERSSIRCEWAVGGGCPGGCA